MKKEIKNDKDGTKRMYKNGTIDYFFLKIFAKEGPSDYEKNSIPDTKISYRYSLITTGDAGMHFFQNNSLSWQL